MTEKILESPSECKEIKPTISKGNQPWIFTGGTDAETEAPILWLPESNSWLIGKDLDAGENLVQEEKGATEDEMAGWHHRLDGHESEWTPVVGDGQGGLACCDSWGREESDTTEQLNWIEGMATSGRERAADIFPLETFCEDEYSALKYRLYWSTIREFSEKE